VVGAGGGVVMGCGVGNLLEWRWGMEPVFNFQGNAARSLTTAEGMVGR
jgi:hypothetical protein